MINKHRGRTMQLSKNLKLHKESGMTLIELMIAMTVLAVGLAGIMAIVIAALYGNARNRTDTSATLISQMVIEQMGDMPANTDTTFQLTDCAGTVWNINTAAGGATLKGTNNFPVWVASDIDFNVAAPAAGYSMLYVSCATNGSPGLTYDVRWNVAKNGQTKTVVVAARIKGTGATTGGAQNIYFAIPVQLKTVLGS